VPLAVNFTLTNVLPHRYNSHGRFVADLDDNGHLDLYPNNGAGWGVKTGPVYASVLY